MCCVRWEVFCTAVLCLYGILLSSAQATLGELVQKNVCVAEKFTAECPDNHIIVIQSAFYGRMEKCRCAKIDLGYIGCKEDVLYIADRKCSGKKSCTISVPSKELEDTKPCNSELKSYLNITYRCQKVLLPTAENCDNYDYQNNVTLTRGNISNQVSGSPDSLCGSVNQPWIITAKSGQTISLQLIDFSVNYGHGYFTAPNYQDPNVAVCNPYGTVRDVAANHNKSICGGQKRVSNLLHSIANQVEIRFNPKEAAKNYIISYQILGCPDKKPADGVWYKRMSHDHAAMGCSRPHAELTWNLHCEGHAWVGPRGNCSASLAAGMDDGVRHKENGIHVGVAIAIIIFAALVVGGVIVIVGFYRYRRREPTELATDYTTQTMLLRQRPPDQYEMRCTCPVPPQPQKVQTLARQHRVPADSRQQTLHRSPQVPRHYSLSQTVTVNGNEYEHIWQTPLPKPRGVTTDKPTTPKSRGSETPTTPKSRLTDTPTSPTSRHTPTSPKSSHDTTTTTPSRGVSETSTPPKSPENGEYTKYKTDKDDTDRDRPYYIRSKDIYDGSKDNCRTSTGYSTLRKNNQVISNQPADV